MFKYKVTFDDGGGAVEMKDINADNFKITRTGALAFYAQPHPQHAIEAFACGTWTRVERIAND